MLGQLTPVVRLCVPLMAGVLGVRVVTFASATLIGNALWNALFMVLGFALSQHARHPASVGMGIIVALLLCEALLAIAWRRRHATNAA